MVPALRIRRDKPVNERQVNNWFGQQFDSAQLHYRKEVLVYYTASTFFVAFFTNNKLFAYTQNSS